MTQGTLSLIICTYNRSHALRVLLESILGQVLAPYEIIVVDGSTNTESASVSDLFRAKLNLRYFLVEPEFRGLTRQRNFGLSQVSDQAELIAFLDDDVCLDALYFEELVKTFTMYPEAMGVGGYVSNEVKWEYVGDHYQASRNDYYMDGWRRREQLRMMVRKALGLYPRELAGQVTPSSHALSLGYLPPSGRVYEVDFLKGCSMTFRREVFESVGFSSFFEGYGLYEDTDFTLRVRMQCGKLFVNTKAALLHFHEPSSRPNLFNYGFMVVRNGWYVWRVGNRTPLAVDRIKWWLITFLLTVIRFLATITGPGRSQALTETIGRFWGMISVFVKSPELEKYEQENQKVIVRFSSKG